jgi:hypothetical protein
MDEERSEDELDEDLMDPPAGTVNRAGRVKYDEISQVFRP